MVDYKGFEGAFQRQPATRELLDAIEASLKTGRSPYEGHVPPCADLEGMVSEWLSEEAFHCHGNAGRTYPECGGPVRCNRRCSASYWRGHCRDVAEGMARLAKVLGQDEELWYATGMVHDLDYLKYPHHEGTVPSAAAHPVGIAKRLHEMGAPPVMTLAVLAHAPHLGLKPTSPLALALVACDEHATMSGAGWQPAYSDGIPHCLTAVLRPSSSDIEGYVRDDMMRRAEWALRGLAQTLERVSKTLRTPIDWDTVEQVGCQ